MTKRTFLVVLVIVFVLGISPIQAQDVDPDVAIRLERTPCFGTCPVYSITILQDGTVIYNGEAHVDVVTEVTVQIDPATVDLMVDAFVAAGFFGWDEFYDDSTITDLPSVITTVTHEGQTHQVSRYSADESIPLELLFLEAWIERMVNASAWTGIEPDISGIPKGLDQPRVALERSACLGDCPEYGIAAYDDGTIVYMGVSNVDNTGVYVFDGDPFVVEGIVDEAAAYGFFDWQDSYEEYIIYDLPTVTITMWRGDEFKQITRYVGDPNAPVGLLFLEERIDELRDYMNS